MCRSIQNFQIPVVNPPVFDYHLKVFTAVSEEIWGQIIKHLIPTGCTDLLSDQVVWQIQSFLARMMEQFQSSDQPFWKQNLKACFVGLTIEGSVWKHDKSVEFL